MTPAQFGTSGRFDLYCRTADADPVVIRDVDADTAASVIAAVLATAPDGIGQIDAYCRAIGHVASVWRHGGRARIEPIMSPPALPSDWQIAPDGIADGLANARELAAGGARGVAAEIVAETAPDAVIGPVPIAALDGIGDRCRAGSSSLKGARRQVRAGERIVAWHDGPTSGGYAIVTADAVPAVLAAAAEGVR